MASRCLDGWPSPEFFHHEEGTTRSIAGGMELALFLEECHQKDGYHIGNLSFLEESTSKSSANPGTFLRESY